MDGIEWDLWDGMGWDRWDEWDTDGMGWMGWGKDKWLCPLSGKKFKVWDVYGMYGMYRVHMGCMGWDGWDTDGMGWGKDKWLCPLSGKKFKGPEFVRKHIYNKHGDKMGAVRKEVLFFNNFLMDPKRPALPEGKVGPPPRASLAPGLPYPPQTPQGMMPYGQPRPPMLGYGGKGGSMGRVH
uniref:Uncharacterized protein n=1 Tax=Melopsittacus undulatus TaxID=13146 RepID=A0A8V5GSJ6_MELUD